MSPNDNALDRIREDLIRRALERRDTDLEYGEAPPRRACEENRHSHASRLSSISVAHRPMAIGQEPQSPKSPITEHPSTHRISRFTIPHIRRIISSRPVSQAEWPTGEWRLPEPVTEARSSVRAPSSYYPTTELFINGPPSSRSEVEQERRRGIRSNRCKKRKKQTPGSESPKRFLFFFPWVQSNAMRSHILRCFVSGLFLMSLLSVYLGLSTSNKISFTEFTIVLVLVVILAAMFFSYSLARLCIFIMRSNRAEPQNRHGPELLPPGAYVMPREPIPVVLARDEEAKGGESTTANATPPAYGIWRESVRVNPDCLFWKKNEASAQETRPATSSSRRPPSYASDDGVEYAVEARPRSIAPGRLSQMLPPLPVDARISEARETSGQVAIARVA